jgi:hypothetical protein
MEDKDKNKEKKDALRHLQACDQAGALMGHVAIVISSYFKALIANGLSKDEAIILTTAYQNLIISTGINNLPKDDDLKNEDY